MKIDKQTIIERLRPEMSNLLHELKPDAKPAGNGKLLAHCMFPENHSNGDANPSLLLFLDTGGYKCQACGAKGSLFDLYGHIYGLDFKQSLHALAEKAGILERQHWPCNSLMQLTRELAFSACKR